MSITEFFQAIQNGNLQTVEQMLNRDAALVDAYNEQGLSALMFATYHHEPEIAAMLVDRGASLNVYEAAATGNLPHLQEWVEEHPEVVNSYGLDGFQPLALAAFFAKLFSWTPPESTIPNPV